MWGEGEYAGLSVKRNQPVVGHGTQKGHKSFQTELADLGLKLSAKRSLAHDDTTESNPAPHHQAAGSNKIPHPFFRNHAAARQYQWDAIISLSSGHRRLAVASRQRAFRQVNALLTATNPAAIP